MKNQPLPIQQYLRTFLLLSFLWLAVIPLANYIIDPYGIFGTTFLKYSHQKNERFIKIEYLKKNHHQFNGYMFGSSRLGSATPELLRQYIDDGRFYNLYASGANQWDNLKLLKYMLRNNYNIKFIYLQVDLEPKFGPSPQHLLKMHPEVLDKSLIRFYFHHLLIFPYSDFKKTIENNIKKKNTALFNWTTGVYSRPSLEKKIKKNHAAYILEMRDFQKKHYRNSIFSTKDLFNIDQNINALSQIIKLSKEFSFDLYLFTTPFNQHMLDELNTEMYLYYLSELAKLSDFWDFGGYNIITTNDKYYYEISHYRPVVNPMIAARIFTNDLDNKTNLFGVHVSEKNIDNHLVQIKRQFDH